MLRYELRTKKEQLKARRIALVLLLTLAAMVVARGIVESGFTLEFVFSVLPPLVILSVIPVSILVLDRGQWNTIDIQDEGCILTSHARQLVLLKQVLSEVRTNTMKRDGVRYGVVRISSHIKDLTFKLKLEQENAAEVYQWFEEIEATQTGNQQTKGLEGPNETAEHIGYPKKHQWLDRISDVLVPAGTGSVLVGWLLFAIYVANVSLQSLVMVSLSVVLLIAIMIWSRKHNPPQKRIVRSVLEPRRLLLEDVKGRIHQVRMSDIQEIKWVSRRDRFFESISTYRIIARQGSWLICVRDGVDGGVVLNRWLKASIGEHLET